mmetsp:Transcript_9766/g.14670  ORF Transcript_9766/g.14670 Transcript_9766/m.14670 type:complete len:686 (+) Transcript_9766:102-2159(+)
MENGQAVQAIPVDEKSEYEPIERGVPVIAPDGKVMLSQRTDKPKGIDFLPLADFHWWPQDTSNTVIKAIGILSGVGLAVVGACAENELPSVHYLGAVFFIGGQAIFDMVCVARHTYFGAERVDVNGKIRGYKNRCIQGLHTAISIIGAVSALVFIILMLQERVGNIQLYTVIAEWITILMAISFQLFWGFEFTNLRLRALSFIGSALAYLTVGSACITWAMYSPTYKEEYWREGVFVSDCAVGDVYSPNRYIFRLGCVISGGFLAENNLNCIAFTRDEHQGTAAERNENDDVDTYQYSWGWLRVGLMWGFIIVSEGFLINMLIDNTIELQNTTFTDKEIADGKMLAHTMSIWMAIHFQFLFIGFIPPLIIWSSAGEWTAPPFRYNPEKKLILDYHTLPAFGWLLAATLQVYCIGHGMNEQHKQIGLVISVILFGGFFFTAMFSRGAKVSPLGDQTMFMELGLAFACIGYAILGMLAIAFGYVLLHKICMVACILDSSGPGIFRFLRTTRELIACRLGSVERYLLYDQVLLPTNREMNHIQRGSENEARRAKENWYGRIRNFQAVESTYFVAAFVLTTFGVAVPYAMAGLIGHWLVIFILVMPVSWPFVGMMLGLKFDWSWDYTFNVFDLAPMPPKGAGEDNLIYDIHDPLHKASNECGFSNFCNCLCFKTRTFSNEYSHVHEHEE